MEFVGKYVEHEIIFGFSVGCFIYRKTPMEGGVRGILAVYLLNTI